MTDKNTSNPIDALKDMMHTAEENCANYRYLALPRELGEQILTYNGANSDDEAEGSYPVPRRTPSEDDFVSSSSSMIVGYDTVYWQNGLFLIAEENGTISIGSNNASNSGTIPLKLLGIQKPGSASSSMTNNKSYHISFDGVTRCHVVEAD